MLTGDDSFRILMLPFLCLAVTRCATLPMTPSSIYFRGQLCTPRPLRCLFWWVLCFLSRGAEVESRVHYTIESMCLFNPIFQEWFIIFSALSIMTCPVCASSTWSGRLTSSISTEPDGSTTSFAQSTFRSLGSPFCLPDPSHQRSILDSRCNILIVKLWPVS